MREIVLLDTSVYLNVLDVPGFNQDRDDILNEFRERIDKESHFLLPMATIWETGKHIADVTNGGQRFSYAEKLVVDVQKAIQGDTPYRPTHFPTREEFLDWLSDFPNHAKLNKSLKHTHEGVSLANLSIIKEWERACSLHKLSRVLIWSLDSLLSSYNTIAK